MITVDEIKEKVKDVVKNYPVKKVVLFGSRARGDNKPDGDVDLLLEFYMQHRNCIFLKLKGI